MTIKGLQAELAILKSSINSDTPTSVNHTGTSSSQSEQQVTLDMVDRKSNLVVFGMKECESGVNRGVHIITDTEMLFKSSMKLIQNSLFRTLKTVFVWGNIT